MTPEEAFKELNHISSRLLGPGGCPWDQKQTLQSMKKYVEEEVGELFETIDEDKDERILEELGDHFFNAFFLAKIAEKEERFTVADLINYINKKLIRRHPHVFGDAKVETLEELEAQWAKIKEAEKNGLT